MEINRRTLFKIISMAAALFVLEKHVDILPESHEEVHTQPGPIREVIDLEIDDYGATFRFPRVAKMSHEEKAKHWIEVKMNDMSILQVPCFMISDKGFRLPHSIRFKEGQYVVAYLYSES